MFCVTKQALRGSVPGNDIATRIRQNNGVGRRFHDTSKPLLALPPGMLDVLGFQSKSFSCHRATHGRSHFFQVEGLGEIGKRAFPQRSDLIFFGRLGGDDDDRKLRI